MEPSGIIFAALDCDADAIEAWNRWYDLEHTPMNVCIDGVMLSRRYVSPPALQVVVAHDALPASAWLAPLAAKSAAPPAQLLYARFLV